MHTKDTAQEAYYRTSESSAETSAPKSRFHDGGGSMDNIISPDEPKVKDYEALSVDGLEKELDDDINITPEEKAEAKAQLGKMRQEEAWDNEILDCILEFKQK